MPMYYQPMLYYIYKCIFTNINSVDGELAASILSVNDVGRELYDDFVDNRIKSTTVNIHDPIK